MSLESLQYRISEDDETAFEELFGLFFPGLLSFSISLLKDRQLAEEVVQDVFIKLWENRRRIKDIRNISTYLYKAVKYASIDALKKQKRLKSVSIDEMGETFVFSYSPNVSSLVSTENCLKISNAINRLPTKCRLIFRLIKEEGMKYKEVAKLLGLSEKTIENQMNIAIKKLIIVLKSDFSEYFLYFSTPKDKRV